MKILITTQYNPEDKTTKLLQYQNLPQETENIKHSIVEIEELQPKQGFMITMDWDNEQKTLVQKYVEIPKTKEEELEDKLIRLERVLAGNISDDDLIDLPLEAKPNSLNARGKAKPKKKLIEPTTDDLAELDNLI